LAWGPAMSDDLSFGGWLRQRRTELGITRDEFSERIDISPALLRKLESGERRPSGQIAYLLADYFRIPSDEREAFVTFARTGRIASSPAETTSATSKLAPWRQVYSHQTNLPAVLTPLIGREQEVATVHEQIKNPMTRLLTLTGAPGIGKTRLALRVAFDLVKDFEHGVFFVDLAPIVDPQLVPATIAHTLGLKESGDVPLDRVLLEFVRERKMLLLLDNFEQVLDAATSVVRLLEGGPWLKALVTSREALHVRGERRFPVPPLELPELKHLPTPQELLRCPSVELFVERSRLPAPDFTLTEQNAGAVARICLALDGLPLAIELAAGHAGFLSPQEIEARLGSRLQLLKTRARDLPDRQRTLRGAIEWSYNLLAAPEQTVFRRLGAFVGGCTIEAASTVAGTALNGKADLDTDVVEQLETLIDKSMITRGDGVSGRVGTRAGDALQDSKPGGRLGMLETLKEYALEQLAACGEEEETRDRHARYYLTFVQEGGDREHILGVEVVPWVERVAADYNNLREALAWLLDEHDRTPLEFELGRVLLGAELCTALWPFWDGQKNHIGEARSWYARAAERIASLVEATDYVNQGMTATSMARELSPELPASWATMLTGAGAMAYYQGDYEAARILNESGLAVRRQIGNKDGIRASLNNLGITATDQGDYLAARRYLSESLDIARELDISWGISAALSNLGIVEINLGNIGSARSLLEEALSITRAVEGILGTADGLKNLSIVARLEGDYAEARGCLDEALAIYAQFDSKVGTAEALTTLGSVARDAGDYCEARALYSNGLSVLAQVGKKMVIADCLEGLASVAGKQGEPERAGRLFGAAERLREITGVPLTPSERPYYDRYLAAAREQLDEEQWNAAWAEGRAMTLEEAVASALELGLSFRPTP
jgi:predicted ATPase/transcriptional regulator with XRE-family HTH domain/Flp pilus assembly protein TadD